MSVIAASLGFPRIGLKRELKHALEAYWAGRSSEAELLAVGAELRARHWRLQREAGLDHIPSNDFSFYDQVLDWSCLVGCIPERFGRTGDAAGLATYFSMARGRQDASGEVVPLELSKWFDTNYHYLVPEFAPQQSFRLIGSKIFDEYREARALGIHTRPVLLGPLTFVRLGKKQAGADYCRSTLIGKLLPVYVQILRRLEGLGARWVQIDEPALALDLPERYAAACSEFYRALCTAVPEVSVLVATYFETLRDNTNLTFSLPVAGVHVDLCRGPGQANTGANADLQALLAGYLERAQGKVLSLGVVDGRNVWRNDLAASLHLVETAVRRLGADRVCVAPSCSLLHVPVDLAAEAGFDAEVRGWLAFAVQKLTEVVTLARGANRGRSAIAEGLAASEAARAARHSSPRVRDEAVQGRLAAISPSMLRRRSPYAERRRVQRERLRLPLLPTTTIGSFPQTREIRAARAAYKRGELGAAQYRVAMQQEIRAVLDYQLEVGLDVLVHGEAERNDMVEYFGEQLAGFAFTGNGWVQSYGSRCVKPPILYGDVSRPRPMTVEWTQYAQRLTDRPVKGMLTGPITLLQWSFVRDDQPRRLTTRQLALAVRDEVVDLERAGIRIVQIDEAALREGLPLRRADWRAYLEAAVEDFRLASSGVQDRTQIHTHMCYSEFNDIVESIAALDADVISIETSRSRMELLAAFARFKYPNEIGPGIYDIHSPRVPEVEEMFALLRRAAEVLAPEQLWVNPDCGLKTRGWAEVQPALQNMVAAARRARAELSASAATPLDGG